MRNNRRRGSLYESVSSSALDAAPFSLNGQATSKPSYFQQRFGGTIGGPFTIPKLYTGDTRTFFFLNYTGNRSHTPYDAYSRVLTPAERSGDFSALGQAIVDPTTGLPFPGGIIPGDRIDPSARALLAVMPSPNQSSLQNFHYSTTTTTSQHDINIRFIRTFGASTPRPGSPQGPQEGPGGLGPPGRAGGGPGSGGGRFGRGGRNTRNLNIGLHYRRSDSTSAGLWPTLGGTSKSSAWDIPVGYTFGYKGLMHSLSLHFNRQERTGINLYAFAQDIAGDAGLLGVSTAPFDWGVPSLSFSSISSVRDTTPSTRTDQTFSIGDSIVKTVGNHTLRFGGDYRHVGFDSRSDNNPRGSYVFTGLYTGLDLADYLLGLPQQATVQFGAGVNSFSASSVDAYLQDDWRIGANVTLNAGVRYEYQSPYTEAANHLVTLDIDPTFSAATPVEAGQTGPYYGTFPDTIVTADGNNVAPRVGVAWRAMKSTIIRAGYGINYSTSAYPAIAQQLALQPPFSTTNTVLATLENPAVFQTALLTATGVATNNFAVDPNFRVPWVQIWNLDVQRDLTRTLTLNVAYIGTRGSSLEIVRAPNRSADGLTIQGVSSFYYETSQGQSITHGLTLRLRKRLTKGFAAGGSYTFSKSIDNASSIGGSGTVVAQNDQDLAAERGLSSFDQRHRFAANMTWQLPFGSDGRWAQHGVPAAVFGGWSWNMNLQLSSGTPFTARVLGSTSDVANGVNGTLRADTTGQKVALDHPTTTEFFNTAAFIVPLPGEFGTAGRNTIIGPGTSVFNLSLTRNINFGTTRGLSIQIQANNLFNTVQFATVDTVVNSPTFGQVTGVRPMRRIQITTRFRF